MRRFGFLLQLCSFFVLVGIDQLTKVLAMGCGLVTINSGVSFELLSGLSAQAITLLIMIAGLGLLVFLRKHWLSSPEALVMVSAGGASNLIDRLRLGGVIDYLPIPLTHLHNNLADWFIFLGLAWLVWREWRLSRDSQAAS